MKWWDSFHGLLVPQWKLGWGSGLSASCHNRGEDLVPCLFQHRDVRSDPALWCQALMAEGDQTRDHATLHESDCDC